MTSNTKTIYLPYMADHAVTMAAALRCHKLDAVVMDEPDDESLAIGQSLCLGKECLPCFTCVGDIVKQSRKPDFDPERAALFMPTTGGPCRFGQYNALHRLLLDEMGLQAVEIVSPSAENSYQGFGEHATALRLLIWRGVVGVDLLRKLRYAHRPYETVPGQTDAVYYECLYDLAGAIETGKRRPAIAAMARAGAKFRALPVARREPRPVIGMVGEIYLRNNDFTNQEIVRHVEALGGEVWVAPLMEWFYFTNYGTKARARVAGDHLGWLKTQAGDLIQRRIEHEMLKPVQDLLRNAHEVPVDQLMENDRPYYDPALGTEAALSIGKAIDYARQGLSGILHVLPLNCMPATTVTGIAPKVRQDLDRIPWLDIIYDAQAMTNINTRLEAFMYQARQYQQRRGKYSH
ncbi:MAG: hypothetical protein JXA21_20950 [Anaerolineae bacterium]|nr:hypothetical protein [Anaerolineae bacterium]